MLDNRITIRINEKDFKKLQEQSASNSLSMSQLARILITKGVQEDWKLKPEERTHGEKKTKLDKN